MTNTTFKSGIDSGTADKVLEYTKDIKKSLKLLTIYACEEIIGAVLLVIAFLLTGQVL